MVYGVADNVIYHSAPQCCLAQFRAREWNEYLAGGDVVVGREGGD